MKFFPIRISDGLFPFSRNNSDMWTVKGITDFSSGEPIYPPAIIINYILFTIQGHPAAIAAIPDSASRQISRLVNHKFTNAYVQTCLVEKLVFRLNFSLAFYILKSAYLNGQAQTQD